MRRVKLLREEGGYNNAGIFDKKKRSKTKVECRLLSTDYIFPADQSRFSSWTVGSLEADGPAAGDECCRDMTVVHCGEGWDPSSAEPRREEDSRGG